jgi:hypothetical protein
MVSAFPNSLISMTRILQCFRQSGAPLYLADLVMKVVSEEVLANRLNLSSVPSYDSTMKRLSNLFRIPRPLMRSIPLERTLREQQQHIYHETPSFPTYSFIEQLQDLLSLSDIFQDLDNLVVNKDNRWHPYERNVDPANEEFQDAGWFQNANNPEYIEEEFTLGIVLYTDKTGVGALNPTGMEPLVFTLSLFPEHIRRRPECWRPLGFVPQFRKKSAALERSLNATKQTSGRLVRNYHRVLDTLLAGVVAAQKAPPIVRLQLGDEWKFVKVRIVVNAILGDALSNDVICGRVASRNGTLRLCRACHITQRMSDDPNHHCKYLKQAHLERIILSALGPETDISNESYSSSWDAFVEIQIEESGKTGNSAKTLKRSFLLALQRRQDICRDILRRVLGAHVVDNAFFKIDFGNNPRGIFGATPTDPMHAFEEGLVPMLLEVILDPLPDSSKKALDSLVESLFSKSNNRSTQRADYPRISFSGGYSSLTQLSADEKVGKLFALAIIGETEVGRKILSDRCDPQFDGRRTDRAKRFQPNIGESSDSDSDDDSDDDIPQTPHVSSINQNRPWSKTEFDPDNESHVDFVDRQLKKHGLAYIIPLLLQMGTLHQTTARSLVWKQTRTLIKDYSMNTIQASIPNSEDTTTLEADRFCADRRPNLHSNTTDHSSDQFYEHSPFGANNEECDSWGEEEELAKSEHSITCDSVDYLLEIVQLFLAFHSFYKYGCGLFGITGFDKIDERVRDMMNKLHKTVRRGEGTLGWCVSKFHDTLHMALDMQLFGSSDNSDTSKGEHGLKIWAKLPSKTAQVNHGANQFIAQISKRLYEQTLLDKACSILIPSVDRPNKIRAPLEVPLFYIDRDARICFHCDRRFKKRKKQELALSLDIEDWIIGEQTQIKSNTVVIYSQLFLEEQDQLFRATPNFRNTGSWYDWVLVNYVNSSQALVQYPFKILGFVSQDDGLGPICFGQMCASQNVGETQKTRRGLFEHWHLETKPGTQKAVYRFVEIDTIISTCLVIQLSENSFHDSNHADMFPDMFYDSNISFTNKVIVVKDRRTVWPKVFLTGLVRLRKTKQRKRQKR